MTNDQAIVIAAASLIGKTINIGDEVDGDQIVTLNTPEDALRFAAKMLVAQVNHTSQMMAQANSRMQIVGPNIQGRPV